MIDYHRLILHRLRKRSIQTRYFLRTIIMIIMLKSYGLRAVEIVSKLADLWLVHDVFWHWHLSRSIFLYLLIRLNRLIIVFQIGNSHAALVLRLATLRNVAGVENLVSGS